MNAVPKKAVVLAAGLGTRMRPLSHDLPKPLMPFHGRPSLERALLMLRDWGVEEVLVNLHAGAGDMLAWILANPVRGLRLSLSHEPAVLGTGGALVRARWFLDANPFWIVNADIACALDPAPLRAAFDAPGVLASVWVHAGCGPRTVETDRGYVRDFRSATPGAPGTATFCGVHLADPEVLRFLPREERFGTIVSAYEAAIRAGRRIAAVEIPGSFWADLGTPRQVIEAHRATASIQHPIPNTHQPTSNIQQPTANSQRGRARVHGGLHRCTQDVSSRPLDSGCWSLAVGCWLLAVDRRAFPRPSSLAPLPFTVRGFASVAPDAVIGRGAVLEDSIVWPGARVAPGARLCGAIVGRDAVARGTVRGPLVRAELVLAEGERAVLGRMLGTDVSAEAFEPRGSDRTFLRLRGSLAGALLIRYGRERPENERYAGHARFLAGLGVRVPRILADNPAARFLVMEDLGDRTLADVIAGAADRRIVTAYAAVVRAMARWHVAGAAAARRRRRGLEEPFGPVLFEREHRLFLDQFLAGRLHAPAPLAAAVARDLKTVASWLADAPPVLLHRDLQSSNVLWVRGAPAFIDFQGMRYGPAMYDLASLLCDPYVAIPPAVRERALAVYVEEVGARTARPDLFAAAAVQRLTQALGAYARLGAIRGAERFLRHIPPALALLAGAIRGCPAPLQALEEITTRSASDRSPAGGPCSR